MKKKDMTLTVLDSLARRITVLEGKMIEMQKQYWQPIPNAKDGDTISEGCISITGMAEANNG